ncbi:MAG: hypothetical protein ACTSRI_16515 [Promethearchaeota archaeon]
MLSCIPFLSFAACSKRLFTSSKHLSILSKRLSILSKRLFTSSKRLFVSSKRLLIFLFISSNLLLECSINRAISSFVATTPESAVIMVPFISSSSRISIGKIFISSSSHISIGKIFSYQYW